MNNNSGGLLERKKSEGQPLSNAPPKYKKHGPVCMCLGFVEGARVACWMKRKIHSAFVAFHVHWWPGLAASCTDSQSDTIICICRASLSSIHKIPSSSTRVYGESRTTSNPHQQQVSMKSDESLRSSQIRLLWKPIRGLRFQVFPMPDP